MSAGPEQRRWRQVQDLFHRALELSRERREAFLEQHCPEDPALLAEVRELLEHARSEDALASGGEPAPLVREDLSGTQLGPYRLLRIVGEGSMGVIYEARQRWVERSVALKILRRRHDVLGPSGSAEAYERMTARFLAEAEVLGLLDHPGIVPIHTVERSQEDGAERAYFTMRLVRGDDFRDVIVRLHAGAERSAGWTLPRALGVVLRVCETMAFAHRRGVLHRDLKPSHILVGDFGEVYLVDWGLAKLPRRPELRDLRLREEQPASGPAEATRVPAPLRTVEGDVIGTPAYMPPEQARGQLERLDERSDVYSVGAILYHLLSGRAPYLEPDELDGGLPSGHAVLERVRLRAPAPLARLAPAVPAALVAICEKAMQREPQARYRDMAALAEDLRAFLENRVVTAHRTGPLVELSKWLQRNRLLAGAAALVLVLVLGWGLSVLQLERNKNRVLARSIGETRIERDHAREQAAIATAATAFMDAMFRSLHPREAQGEAVTVRDALDRASTELQAFDGPARVEGEIRAILGVAYQQLGFYSLAEPHLERAWRARREALGDRHPATLAVMGDYGVLLRDLARFEEAEPLLRRAAEWAPEVFGDSSPEALHARALLAQLLLDRERYDEALSLARELVQALEGRPEAAPDLLVALEVLGSAHYRRDELAAAEEAFRRQRQCALDLHGPEHSDALIATTNLAAALDARGRHAEALQLSLELVERATAIFGPLHRETLTVRANAGLMLCNQGRVDEGLELLAGTLEDQSAVFGDDHPAVLLAAYNLAEILRRERRFEEALPLFLDLRDRQRDLDPDHPDVRRTLLGLADCLMAVEDYENAVQALNTLLPIQRRNVGGVLTDAPDTAAQLAFCYEKLGWDEALRELRRTNDDMPDRR